VQQPERRKPAPPGVRRMEVIRRQKSNSDIVSGISRSSAAVEGEQTRCEEEDGQTRDMEDVLMRQVRQTERVNAGGEDAMLEEILRLYC